jgi:DNA polymerase I
MHHRSALRRRLIDTCPVPVYENYTLDKDLTAKWVDSLGLRSWPRTAKTRTYMLDKETLKMMGRLCPEVEEFRQLKKSLSTLQDQKKGLLPIGADNRNRFSIRPFMAKTGRNLPLAHTFIFAQAAWFRNLIVAPPGYGLIYADWRQQEFFLAGHLSGDEQMLTAYKTGDPYMAAAIQWGLAPRGASEDTHGTIRDMVKTAVLAIQYGIQAVSLGLRLGKPTAFAAEILRLHKTTYRRYWQWIDSLLDSVSHRRVISTPLGWRMRIKGRLNERSLGNYPMQSTGGDLMRLAACHAVEAGLEIVALIHDAFLALAPLNRLQADAEMLEAYMRQACVDILGTNELRSKTVTFAYPEHFVEKKGLDLYHKVLGLLDELDAEEAHLQPELIPV